jgi:GNAT superfamily N-acetyltransferase
MGDAAARHAAVDDLATVRALVQLSRADRLTERGGVALERLEPRPVLDESMLTDDGVLVALGSYAGVVFGFAHAAVVDAGGTPIVRLYDLFVEPDARGVGVGEALLDFVFAWARDHHAHAIDSIVLPGNREGKNFFERFGLVARAIHVYRELDRDA